MTTIKVTRPDLLNDPSGLAQWQVAVFAYLKFRNYADRSMTMICDSKCDVTATFSPDFDSDQVSDLTAKLGTLKSVLTSRPAGSALQYEFLYI